MGIRKEAPATAAQAGTRMLPWHITLLGARTELAAPAGNAAWAPPTRCFQEPPHAPPSRAVQSAPCAGRAPRISASPRALLSRLLRLAHPFPPPALFFPPFHLLLSHLPFSGSQRQLTTVAPLGWRQRRRLLLA